MHEWASQFLVSEHPGNADLSADFLLRLVPVRPDGAGPRLIGWDESAHPEEVELQIEVAPCGEILSLHFHGKCYDT